MLQPLLVFPREIYIRYYERITTDWVSGALLKEPPIKGHNDYSVSMAALEDGVAKRPIVRHHYILS